MARRYSYLCRVCGTEYESRYKQPGQRFCMEHAGEFARLVNLLQMDPVYSARLKQLMDEFLPEDYKQWHFLPPNKAPQTGAAV